MSPEDTTSLISAEALLTLALHGSVTPSISLNLTSQQEETLLLLLGMSVGFDPVSQRGVVSLGGHAVV